MKEGDKKKAYACYDGSRGNRIRWVAGGSIEKYSREGVTELEVRTKEL